VIEFILFAIVGLFVFVTAVLVIYASNPMHAALGLAGTLVGLAVIFLLLSASFVGMMQIMIYAGAVGILYIFIVTTYAKREPKGLLILTREFFKVPRILVILGAIIIFVLPSWTVWQYFKFSNLPAPQEGMGTIEQVGAELFTKFAIHFEVISILILAALVGVIAIARRPEREDE